MAGLTSKVVTSLGWVFANIVTKNVLQFARTVILWRILSEDDFGLNGMAWLAINAFVLLQDMGFQSALVQRRGDITKAISVAWYANVVIRSVIYGVIFLAAPYVAAYFEEPEVCSLLRVAGLAIVIISLSNVNETVLRRSFQFKKILVVDTADLSVRVAAQATLALNGFGVWSLVYGHLAAIVTRGVALWILAPIRVGKFDPKVAREMFHFGKHMTLSTVFLWIIGHLDYLFIGKFLGKAALGFYTLAFQLAFQLARNVARMLGSVLFPAFSEIGGDISRVRDAWLRSIRFSMLLMTPIALGMILFSRDVVSGLYRPEREVVVVPLCILTLSAWFRGIGVPLGDLQKGIGKPYILTIVSFCQLLSVAPFLLLATAPVKPLMASLVGSLHLTGVEESMALLFAYPFEVWVGLTAASTAITTTTLLTGLGLALALTSREVDFTPGDVVRALKPALVAGLAMAVTGLAGKVLLDAAAPSLPALARLAILGPIAVLAFAGTLWLAFPAIVVELRGLLRHLGRKKAA